MAKLIVSGTAHELVDESVTVGRAPENAIVLNDASVSSRHAQLERSGQTYRLRDLGSANGTNVNGESAQELTLRQGDRIRFGGVEARFEADGVKSTQPLPAAQMIAVHSAETSAKPADFANASPFRRLKSESDKTRTILFVAAGLAVLVLLVALVMVFMMRSPAS